MYIDDLLLVRSWSDNQSLSVCLTLHTLMIADQPCFSLVHVALESFQLSDLPSLTHS